MPLAVIAFVLSTVIAIPLGMLAATRHNTAGDYVVKGSARSAWRSNFWFAILLILFAGTAGLVLRRRFRRLGRRERIGPALKSLLLPALALAVTEAAILARVTRSAVLETLREDYVRARTRGPRG